MKLYRDYSSIHLEMFKVDLDQNLNCATITLVTNAPIMKKILRFNNSPFMTKTLRKAIMHISKFKNIYKESRQMIIGQIIKSKGIFVYTYSIKPKKIISRIQTYRIYSITENPGKQSSRILLIKD